ncbi:MAG: hypothetical protein RSC93_08595 [Erysipelotrichaceae bacterium]
MKKSLSYQCLFEKLKPYQPYICVGLFLILFCIVCYVAYYHPDYLFLNKKSDFLHTDNSAPREIELFLASNLFRY